MAFRPISEAAARGYVPAGEQRRRRARRAGLASGRARRARAQGRKQPHARDRQQGLALAYRVRQISRQEFVERFERLRADQGVQVSERGLETRWRAYVALCTRYRADSQDFRTTNAQCAAGLRKQGRARCTRTVQRAHADLAAMGLMVRVHVRRKGSKVGERDCLSVRLLTGFVTPASRAQAAGLRPAAACASQRPDSAACGGRPGSAAAPPGAAPPDGGRHGAGPAAGVNSSDERKSDADDLGPRRAEPSQPVLEGFERRAREARDRLPGVLGDVRRGGRRVR